MGALYHTRDLHDDGDEQRLCALPRPHQLVRTPCADRPRPHLREGTDLTIVTYGTGCT